MVPAIAEGSEQTLSTNLASAVQAGRVTIPPVADLDGSALAGAAARTPGGPVPTTFATLPPQPEAPAEQTIDSSQPVDGESSPTESAQSTTQPQADPPPTTPPGASEPPATEPPTTQPPETAPTTDTTSAAS
jgi:hypothetical protein